jgi:cell division septation protein DedD
VVRTTPVPAAIAPPDDAVDEAPPPPKPAPKPTEKPAPKPAKAADKTVDKPADKPAPTGWRVQLGAYATRAKAEDVWAGVKAKQKAAIGAAKPVFEPAGGIVKLQIGPYPSSGAAHDACERLSAAGTACFTVAPH